MKVLKIGRAIVDTGALWKGRVVAMIEFSKEAPNEIGVPIILDKICDFFPRPRYVVLTGDNIFEQPESELFNLFQVLKSWYGTRGLQKVLVQIPSSVNISSIASNESFREFVRFEILITTPSSEKQEPVITSNFKMNTLGTEDALFFQCRSREDIGYVLHVINNLADVKTFNPVILIQIIDESYLGRANAEVLSWRGPSERFDIRVLSK